jgi:hypothetical protein
MVNSLAGYRTDVESPGIKSGATPADLALTMDSTSTVVTPGVSYLRVLAAGVLSLLACIPGAILGLAAALVASYVAVAAGIALLVFSWMVTVATSVLILHWLTRRHVPPAARVLLGASCGLAIAVPLVGYAVAEAFSAFGGDPVASFMLAAMVVVACWAWVVMQTLNRLAATSGFALGGGNHPLELRERAVPDLASTQVDAEGRQQLRRGA